MNITAVVLLVLVFGFPIQTSAVSPSPFPEERAKKTEKGIRVKGESVCLFQSGTEDVKKTIHVHDVLVVFREGTKHDLTEVGKVRVLSYAGEDYLAAEVMEGEVMYGDIAKKGDVASMIISEEDKCK
jgi:hypothetical protein